jgi:carotenoid cleavage dioxygenase-like enzyme
MFHQSPSLRNDARLDSSFQLIVDFAVTENYAVFHVVPLNCQLQDLKKGGPHFHWDDDLPLYIGLLPRRNPKPEDVKWFEHRNSHVIHVGNAYDGPNGVVHMDAPISYVNAMAKPFPAKKDPKPFDPFAPVPHKYVRFELDPKSDNKLVEAKVLADVNGEYPTVDPRVATRDYTHVFMACFDESVRDDKTGPYVISILC